MQLPLRVALSCGFAVHRTGWGLLVWLIWLAGLVAPPAAAQAPTIVRYPPPEVHQDQRADYPSRLLAMALARSGQRFVPKASGRAMNKSRALLELANGAPDIDVVWAVSDAARERDLLPIRIPIDKGLIGWRLMLVRAADRERFAPLRSLVELAKVPAAQGHDWPDLRILRANGLKVDPVNVYPALFQMLARGRFDYLPRGVHEVADEAALYAGDGLVVEPHIAFHYPAALYFFVNRQRSDLAEAIRVGLERALDDGSFEALFQATYASRIEQAELGRRLVFELVNPLLTPETPLAQRHLWWQPGTPSRGTGKAHSASVQAPR